jgi:diacylglycerol kinase (ATP)
MTVDVIVNRTARRLATDTPLRRALLSACERGGARVHETTTLPDLDRVAAELAARGAGAVVLAGGDGSHMAGVTALARVFGEALPPVALAPCGTVCTIARNFGTRGTARSWTERIVLAACDGTANIEKKATLRVMDDAGGERVGFIFGAGLVARFFEVYYGSRRQGLGTAADIAARVFAGSFVGSPLARRVLDPTRCTAVVDGVPHGCHEWSLIVASVVRDVGLHLLATYRAGKALDRFHVVGSGVSPRALGPQLPRVFLGRPLRGEPRIDALAQSLRVRFEAPEGSYVLDGDVFRASDARVEAGPVLPLLVPGR